MNVATSLYNKTLMEENSPSIASILCPGPSCTPAEPGAEHQSPKGPLLYPQKTLTWRQKFFFLKISDLNYWLP